MPYMDGMGYKMGRNMVQMVGHLIAKFLSARFFPVTFW